MERFWHAFIPLFVALDGVGLLPIYWAMAQRLSAHQRRRVVTQAVLTAFVVTISFLFVSRLILEFLGLAVPDLMIAAGTILLVLSLRDLLLPEEAPKPSSESLGVVPLGVPLLAGPAGPTRLFLARETG